MDTSPLSRRKLLQLGAVGLTMPVFGRAAPTAPYPPLPDFIGINTVCFNWHYRAAAAAQRIDPYDVPRLMSDELGVRVIDVVSTMLNTREHAPLEKFRQEAERARCVITNLKINIPDPLASGDAAVRKQGIEEYKRWIEAAAVLGARWVRPLAGRTMPNWDTLIAGSSEIAAHAAAYNITVLVENYSWLERDADLIPRMVTALSGRIAAQPDTFNWVDHPTRLAGLRNTFPLAKSCDFKVRDLGPNNEHPAYDLHECFKLGWRSGFRGPWCIEHVNKVAPAAAQDKAALIRELKWITHQLRLWTSESKAL